MINAVRYAFLILSLLLAVGCGGQVNVHTTKQDNIPSENFRMETIGIDDGLSQGFVSSIIEDKQGFLWFATRDGLNKYDGYTFKVYRHDPDDTSSLADNNITTLFEDSKGRLWVAMASGGLDLFDKETDRFIHLPQGKKNSIRVNSIDRIIEGPNGSIWVSTPQYPDFIEIIHTVDIHCNSNKN